MRNSGIEPTDIDAMECHGQGVFLADAVEHKAVSSVLNVGSCSPRGLLCMKGSTANMMDGGGTAQMIRAMHSIKWGSMKTSIHLMQANPYVDVDTSSSMLPTEVLEFG